MPPEDPRQWTLDKFRSVRRSGGFLVGAAVGAGLAADAAVAGEADFLMAVSAGRFRMMGAASIACMLPLRDANAFVEEWAFGEVLAQRTIPVFLGISTLTPDLDVEATLDKARQGGFSGVACFPSVLHYESPMREALQAAGLGHAYELSVLARAKEKRLFTVGYAIGADEVRAAATSGVDMICVNFGWNAGGRRGFDPAVTLEVAALRARDAARMLARSGSGALLMLEGGAIRSPTDLTMVLRSASVDGYIGGSTLDRLPIEEAVTGRTLDFKRAAQAVRLLSTEETRLAELGRDAGLAGASTRLLDALRQLDQLSAGEQSFAVVGENGVGKLRAASFAAHRRGVRLEVLDAADLTERQFLIALFGGGVNRAFEGLAGSEEPTLVLMRNVGQLTRAQQRRIAQFCESGRFRAIGSRRARESRLQLCIALPEPADAMVHMGALEPRLGMLFSGREVRLPPLRERPEDLDGLLSEALRRETGTTVRVSPSALRRFCAYPWPGNLVELEAVAARLARSEEPWITDELAATVLDPLQAPSRPQTERDLILDALWRCGFHRERTAKYLGISRKTLFNKIQRYGLMRR